MLCSPVARDKEMPSGSKYCSKPFEPEWDERDEEEMKFVCMACGGDSTSLYICSCCGEKFPSMKEYLRMLKYEVFDRIERGARISGVFLNGKMKSI